MRSGLARSRPFRTGFSFTEVMFAVVVLGVGFIMIAAVFPVAIQQSQATSEETVGASIGRGAASYFETVATSALLPATGTASQPNRPEVFSIRNPQRTSATPTLPNEDLWNAVRGNLILPDDPRYGFVLLYRRAGNPAAPATVASVAQVYVIPVQVRNRSRYEYEPDVSQGSAPPLYNLQARPVEVKVTDGGTTDPDTIEFTDGQSGAVAEGCYVIISSDGLTGADEGLANGQIYRVGVQRTDKSATTWELMPGNDFTPLGAGGTITSLPAAQAFIVGKNTPDPATPTGPYDGSAQDISIYTTFVQVK